MQRAKTVDAYIKNATQWQVELLKLRKILQGTKLEETIKWGAPCYTHNGTNVVGIGAFKSYVGLWFFQGALLKDADNVLHNAQDGKTKAMRQWRFHSAREIKVTKVKTYIVEATGLAEDGKMIMPDRAKPLLVPPELKTALGKNKSAADAFKALTRGKQREYNDFIADAKRADTKVTRLKKILPMIAAGKGLNDKYRK